MTDIIKGYSTSLFVVCSLPHLLSFPSHSITPNIYLFPSHPIGCTATTSRGQDKETLIYIQHVCAYVLTCVCMFVCTCVFVCMRAHACVDGA